MPQRIVPLVSQSFGTLLHWGRGGTATNRKKKADGSSWMTQGPGQGLGSAQRYLYFRTRDPQPAA